MESFLYEQEDDGGRQLFYIIKIINHCYWQEVHILHEFQTDFYGYELKALVLGYIRPELNYTSRG